MARLPRYAAPDIPQHVVQRGNNRSAIFAIEYDVQFFAECLKTACDRNECRVHAYVFMTNHVHLLMSPSTEIGISKVMHWVCGRYAQWFNARYQRTGALFEGRYRATVVETEAYLFACYRYIELNPVRAGLSASPDEFRWSSYAANALGALDSIVVPHDQYRLLGADSNARQAAYRGLFQNALTEETVRAIRDATNRGWALGTQRFRDEIADLVRRRTQPLRKPRPRR
jgi:putative transposase